MKTSQKLLSFLLAACLLLCCAPPATADMPTFSDPVSAGEYVRAGILAREPEIRFFYVTQSTEIGELTENNIKDYFQKLQNDISNTALAHTGVSNEGDYLQKHLGRHKYGCDIKFNSTATALNFNITFTSEYHSNAAQEERVAEEVANALKDLDLDGKTDYEKIRSINDFICDRVEYDNAHVYDDTYKLKFSAYAALINGTAVCQGYANLFYRMALEAGIDCRIISGEAFNGTSIEKHAWNIVRLGGKYYYIDVTWNDGSKSDKYFLVGKDSFGDHFPYTEFTEEPFVSAYPIADTTYQPGKEPGCGGIHTIMIDPAVPATCTQTGLTEGSHCSVCNEILTPQTVVEKAPHHWDAGTVTREATCKATGVKVFTCAVCGTTETASIPVDPDNHADYGTTLVNAKPATATATGYTGDTVCNGCGAVLAAGEVIPVLDQPHTEHTWNGGTVTKKATCKEEGVTTFTCAVCHETKTEPIPVDPDNHADYGTKLVNTKPATATETGYTGDTVCLGCGAVLAAGETIPVLPDDHTHHLVKTEAAEPSCTEEGNDEYYTCDGCGGIFSDAEGKTELTQVPVRPALGHFFSDWEVTVPPTDSGEGVATRICLHCGKKDTKSIPAAGATPDDWIRGVILKPVSLKDNVLRVALFLKGCKGLDSAGIRIRYDNTVLRVLPAGGTDRFHWGKDALALNESSDRELITLEFNSEVQKDREYCGVFFKTACDTDDILELCLLDFEIVNPNAALTVIMLHEQLTIYGHLRSEDYTFTIALEGEEKPEPGETFRPGDVDGDGEVTAADARLALRASVKLEKIEEGSAKFTAADANRDGVIGSDDARLILRAAVKLEDPATWGNAKPDAPQQEDPTEPEPEVPSGPEPENPAEPQETDPVAAFEKEVIRLVNIERAKENLLPLTENPALSKLARQKSQDMHDNNYFNHISPTYGTPYEMISNAGINHTAAGENIAMGQRTPEQVVESWMNSPGHRANILNERFTQIGVGYCAQSNIWTQMFIR